MIMVVNSSFPEINQLAAALAEEKLLSTYVRPYANLKRPWERRLSNWSRLGAVYMRSLGRRSMPAPLSAEHLSEVGVLVDFLAAAYSRLPSKLYGFQTTRKLLFQIRANKVARGAAEMFTDERAVVASWGCAELVFRKAKANGALCVLNYPLAHHHFTRRYLRDEAERRVAFAATLNSHNYSEQLEARYNAEIELADRILVGSNFVRDTFIAEGVSADKLVVIPYGADTRLFEPAKKSFVHNEKLSLLFVGQIGQRKGISYLFEALEQVGNQRNLLTMVGQIQGDGKAIAPYQHLFRHVPHVPRVELREIYRQADIFVFPTLVEGMPLVVLEAMASGLPVITTPNGPGDIVRDGVDGFLVPPRDVDAIVDRLERLRANPTLRAEMGRNARQRALTYTWEAYRKNVVENLQEWLAAGLADGGVPLKNELSLLA